jgi:hypothetical protein
MQTAGPIVFVQHMRPPDIRKHRLSNTYDVRFRTRTNCQLYIGIAHLWHSRTYHAS